MEYFLLFEDDDLPNIEPFAPFKVVLAIEESVSPARRDEIADWLIASGAKYVMVCGSDCDEWVESIRRANLAQVDIDEMQPEQFVMITSHAQEKLRQVYWHASKVARHTHVKMRDILTLHIGQKNRSVEYYAIFDKA
jgi:hypothetical protein